MTAQNVSMQGVSQAKQQVVDKIEVNPVECDPKSFKSWGTFCIKAVIAFH